MGMFSFIKEAGQKLFGTAEVEKAAVAAAADPAAKPTLDFDPEYGRQPGVTTRFVEAVYRSLEEKK